MSLKSCLSSISWTRGKQLVLISLLLIVYLLIGAAVFEALEKPNEIAQEEEYRRLLVEFVNSTNLTEAEVRSFATAIGRLQSAASNVNAQNWDFASSFFFALTVVTTIGYGHISPVTAGGQAFCCVFALLGIPIAGVLLVKLASSLKDRFNSLEDKILQCVPENRLLSKSTAPLYIATVGVVVFIIIPAVIFHRVEDWTFGQSMYYAFITLSTIGFGDFVPAQESDHLRSLYKILVMVWIFVGLAFLTLLLEIVNDLLSKTADAANKLKTNAGKAIGMDGQGFGESTDDTKGSETRNLESATSCTEAL